MLPRVSESGFREIDGVRVEIVRKRVRRVSLRVGADGGVRLSIPSFCVSFARGLEFLQSKWAWVLKTRAAVLSRPPVFRAPVTEADLDALGGLLGELNALWARRLGERDIAWRIRRVRSVWGYCHWRKRYVTYSAELAHAPRELVEYVVVHELTHFAVHNHGPDFYALMDARLPGWKLLRRRLNRREWDSFAGESGK